jgi:hypothetical protein
MPDFPKPNEWVHLALAWDETTGIRFYVNGKLAGEKAATGMFDAALDQFGPHSRIIAPTGVESSYNYDRGGDIDELRIYDRMLSTTTSPRSPGTKSHNPFRQSPHPGRQGLAEGMVVPLRLESAPTTFPALGPVPLRSAKVEIHDAYDLKRWWWKGTDGIRETTWPGVYNRSTLTGRFDLLQLPDWDCYALSGKSVLLRAQPSPGTTSRSRAGRATSLLTPAPASPAVADPTSTTRLTTREDAL